MIRFFGPSLQRPVSQLCTASQFREPVYAEWRDRMGLGRRLHRKAWEFVFIAQVLRHHGCLGPARSGLGFGVGREPLPALFASFGCVILATDQRPDDAAASGWAASSQHAATLADLKRPNICADDSFMARVRFQFADMRTIAGLGSFDFVWSACALEHLGSAEAGMKFVCDTVDLLKPGGLAVHTTEFLTEETKTVDQPGTVLYGEKDIRALARRLRQRGGSISLNLRRGREPIDKIVDVPPYKGDPHLRLRVGEHVTTSIGIVACKR